MSENKNMKILLAYILGWLSGLIVYIVEKNDKEVRKHALQSIIIFGSLSVLGIILGYLSVFLGFIYILVLLLNLVEFVLWIYFIVVSIQGKAKIFPFLESFIEDKV